ncbi:MAG: helix-turn-helix domain-containing protein [Gammaproteobacteria bacterium]
MKQAIERPSVEQVIARVANAYGCDEEAIKQTARGKGKKNTVRWIAMYLSQEVCGETLAHIAEAFHVGHYSTVNQTIGRLKREMARDKKLNKSINMLSQDLTP